MLAEGVQVAGSLVARNEEPEEVGQAAAGKLGADERSESLGR
jgi:hypothetical protein